MKPPAGIWHWSQAEAGPGRLSDLDDLCKRARRAGLDYITFKALDGANDRFLTDSQLEDAQKACERAGLKFSLWQYVYAVRPPKEEAQAFAKVIKRFDPAFVFVDVEKEYEAAEGPVSTEYAAAFRDVLPDFPATIAPFGRADLHSGIDYKAWHDHDFGVAPQAYECESTDLSPTKCAESLSDLWPVQKQWTVVGFYKGARGTVSGADIGRSLRGLPVANISGWYSGDFTDEQMRGIAAHHGPSDDAPGRDHDPGPERDEPESPPDSSIESVQRGLRACGFSVELSNEMDSKTKEAVRFFQAGWCGGHSLDDADGELTDETREAIAWSAKHGGGLGPKAEDFHFQEFRLDNTGEPRVKRKVGLALQAYRDKFGPTTVLSSGRSVEHNKAIGGASDSRHLFPKNWDAIDPSPQVNSVGEVQGVGVWSGIGHHAAAPQSVDHFDLRAGFSPLSPSIFLDH